MFRNINQLGAWCAVLLLIGSFASAALAQDDDDDTKKKKKKTNLESAEYVEVSAPYAPQSSSIVTKLPLDPQMVPANIGGVTSALFNEQQAFTLNDTLSNISGINTQNGSGVHDFFVIRGFNSLDGALLLLDGAIEPEVGYYHTYNVDTIEVFKGPTGFLYGGGPLAGTVNMTRKQPIPANLLDVNLLAGSFGTYQAMLDWNAGSDDGNKGFRINAMVRESDNYRDDKESTQYAVNPTFVTRWGDDSSLNFSFEYVRSEFSPDNGIPIYQNALPDVDRKTNYQSPFDFSDQDAYRMQVDYQTKLSEKVTLRNKTYYRRLEWETFGTLAITTVDPFLPFVPEPLSIRTGTRLDDDQVFYGNQFEAIVTLGERVKNNLLFGVEFQRRDDDFNFGVVNPCLSPFDPSFTPNCMPSISIPNPVEMATQASTIATDFVVGDSTTTILAPYAIDQIKFGPKWELMVGARLDSIDTDVDFAVNNQFFCGSGFSRTDTEVSPMAGLVFAPNEELSIYANAGRAFSPVGPRVLNACELDPEESRQGEIGAKKQFLNGKLHSSAAVYYIERDNTAVPDPNGITLQASDQESEGFELDIAAEFTSRVRLFFNYAYNKAEFSDFVRIDPILMQQENFTGNTPAFAPRNLGRLWLATTFRNGLGVGGGPRYVDDQFVDANNQFEIDAYVTWDATVFYDFARVRLKLNLQNLADEDYETRGFGAASVVPADPFAAYFSVEYRQ